jgi:hypothetical protein
VLPDGTHRTAPLTLAGSLGRCHRIYGSLLVFFEARFMWLAARHMTFPCAVCLFITAQRRNAYASLFRTLAHVQDLLGTLQAALEKLLGVKCAYYVVGTYCWCVDGRELHA